MTIKKLFKQTAYGALFASAAVITYASTASAATEGYGDCPLIGEKGTAKIEPAVADQFTVIINLPAVGQFNGDTPDTIKDGYEFCMAVNVAHRLGLDKVKLVNASFDSIVAGQNKDYDIALALISVTEPRKKVVDFSAPYINSGYGVAARADKPVTEADIKTVKVGTQAGTTLVPFAQDTLKVASLDVFDDTASMFTALAAGKVDAVMTDLSITLGQAHNSNGRLAVVGKYESSGETAGIYPKGSPNGKVIDQLIEDMHKDGTLKKLEEAYLLPSWGTSPDNIPLWKP
ncbi:ABC transporter substrate-binding protein [Brucella pituitosa]|uniref:Amino acid ABC transporter substrate-binding protein n=1 Tax=Brucella pituitosa TaxID=571256 RepID=A0ABS3K312_9HYPH|nr:ABC transporter substrate-binding protein [Brucella pituitosa]MBO1041308.1 amino acid ABC transporter substrate-binding protein [Brucella pituitosa]